MLGLNSGRHFAKSALEGTSVAQDSVQTLIDYSPGSPGMVDFIQIVFSGQNAAGDSWLRVYIDGESTPSIDVDMGTFGTHYGHTMPSRVRMESDLVMVEFGTTATNDGGWRKYDLRFGLPFKSSIRITLTVKGGGATLWTTVLGKLGVNPGVKLYSAGVKWVNRAQSYPYTPTQQGNRSIVYLDRPAGERGWVIWHSECVRGQTNESWQEKNMVMYDKADTPGAMAPTILDSTGTEDFYLGAFYFLHEKYSSRQGFVYKHSNYGRMMARDFSLMGGIPYQNGILFCKEDGVHASGTPSNSNIEFGHTTLYYRPY